MADIKFERLKLLYDYTKFHIGLYATLITALIALMSFGSKVVPQELHYPLKFATIMFVLAGGCGGIIASSSVKFDSIDALRDTCIGPLGIPLLPGKVWATLEHVFFWVGITYAVYKAVQYVAPAAT